MGNPCISKGIRERHFPQNLGMARRIMNTVCPFWGCSWVFLWSARDPLGTVIPQLKLLFPTLPSSRQRCHLPSVAAGAEVPVHCGAGHQSDRAAAVCGPEHAMICVSSLIAPQHPGPSFLQFFLG